MKRKKSSALVSSSSSVGESEKSFDGNDDDDDFEAILKPKNLKKRRRQENTVGEAGGKDDSDFEDKLLLDPPSSVSQCNHPINSLRRVSDGSVICGLCGSVIEGELKTLFFQHCASQVVSSLPAFVAPGESTGNTYVGADGKTRSHFPKGASSAVKKLIAEPSVREMNERHAESEVKKLATRHLLPSSVTAEIHDTMKRIIESDTHVWNRGSYGERVTAAVAYYVCRKHNQPLTLDEIASFQQCSSAAIKKVYKRILPLLGDNIELLDPKSWLKRAVHLMVKEMAGISSKTASDSDESATSMVITKQLEEKMEHVLQTSRQLYQLVVEPNSFNVGRKPLAIVAAIVALAMEVEDGRDTYTYIDDTVRILGAKKKTVTLRYDELIHSLMGSSRKIYFGKRVTIKTLALFIPVILQALENGTLKSESVNTSSSTPKESESSSSCSVAAETTNTNPSANLQPGRLPRSFVKVERMRVKRTKLVADCKKMHDALVKGEPLPKDIEITPEHCEIQKLLLMGIPEESIINNETKMLLKNPQAYCCSVSSSGHVPSIEKEKESVASGEAKTVESNSSNQEEMLGAELDDDEVKAYIRDEEEVSMLGQMRHVTDRDPTEEELVEAANKKARAHSLGGNGYQEGPLAYFVSPLSTQPQQGGAVDPTLQQTGPSATLQFAPREVTVVRAKTANTATQRPSQRPIKVSTRIDRQRLAKLKSTMSQINTNDDNDDSSESSFSSAADLVSQMKQSQRTSEDDLSLPSDFIL